MSSRQPKIWNSPFVGLICLLAYLGAATPLMALLAATTAWIDGEHQVTVAAEGQSSRVVLSHNSQDPVKSFSHSHCAVSRGLVSLAASANPLHSDHVLQFSSAEVAAPRSLLLKPLTAEIPEAVPPLLSAQPLVTPLKFEQAAHAAESSPTAPLSVEVTAVTVLLI